MNKFTKYVVDIMLMVITHEALTEEQILADVINKMEECIENEMDLVIAYREAQWALRGLTAAGRAQHWGQYDEPGKHFFVARVV